MDRQAATADGRGKPGRPGLETVLRSAFERGIAGARNDVMATQAEQARREVFVELSAALLSDLDLAEPGLIGRLAQRFFRAKAFYMAGILEQDLLARVQAILFNAVKGDEKVVMVARLYSIYARSGGSAAASDDAPKKRGRK